MAEERAEASIPKVAAPDPAHRVLDLVLVPTRSRAPGRIRVLGLVPIRVPARALDQGRGHIQVRPARVPDLVRIQALRRRLRRRLARGAGDGVGTMIPSGTIRSRRPQLSAWWLARPPR
ncbi:MAG: hypothetical protein J7521_15140 [Caulobacter sp.]|nr:hypothetical protein [Caulobacter sp.]